MSLVERALAKLRGEPTQGRPGSFAPLRSSAIGTLAVSVRPGDIPPEQAIHHGPTIVVDRTALRSAGYLPESSEDRRFADQYRQIKRPLIAAATGDQKSGHPNQRLIMMASALPGDGKTFTSINLALSMAREKDISVVLVDADVAKPHISRIFGVGSEPGLLEAVADESRDLESLILPTDVKGLSILPAGKPQEGATELLASARFAQLVSQIISRDSRRIALFDSSPLLVSSESKALASAVGQILLVVRAAKTPRQAVLDALEQLGEDALVRLVLNQGRPSLLQSYYGAYGTYGDDYETTR